MGQLAELVPKPMVYIGNRPVLWHIMKIYSYYGYNDFIIALGVKGQVIKEYFYNFEPLNNDFTVELSSGKIIFHSKHKKITANVICIVVPNGTFSQDKA